MDILTKMYIAICIGIHNIFFDEDGAVDIVAIVVLIGIAVLLAVLFREQISNLLTTLFGSITDSATKAVTE